jgi:AcrR family transcriptional regulator
MSAGIAKRRRASRGSGEQLRDEIIAATKDLLAESANSDAVSIRAVADAVGVTPPSIYLHFADKNDLIFAVCERQYARLDAYTDAMLADETDPGQRLNIRGRAYVHFGLENPEQYRVLFMGRPDSAPEQFVDERVAGLAAFDHLVSEVRNCIAAGLFDGDAFVLACGLWAKVHGLTSLLISKPEFPWPPLEVLLDGLSRT